MIARRQDSVPSTHATGVPLFERFFRLAASLDVDKQDLKRYRDFVNHKIRDLLIRGEAAAKANGRNAIEPFDLPITKGLLAPWLGCRAENLSRAFMALRAYGVETHGSRVQLHDIARLKAYVGVAGAVALGGGTEDAEQVNRAPVEKIFGDAFRLRPRRERDG